MTWPMRERQSQAAPVAYNKRARQARHPRLKGSHFIAICEIKCSVAENYIYVSFFAYCQFGRWRGR